MLPTLGFPVGRDEGPGEASVSASERMCSAGARSIRCEAVAADPPVLQLPRLPLTTRLLLARSGVAATRRWPRRNVGCRRSLPSPVVRSVSIAAKRLPRTGHLQVAL